MSERRPKPLVRPFGSARPTVEELEAAGALLRADDDLSALGGPYMEPGSGVSRVVFLEGGQAGIAVEGRLVFERRDRHLVMVTDSTLDDRYVRRIVRSFEATLQERNGQLVVDHLKLAPADDCRGFYEPQDGITGPVIRATRPEAIVAIIRRAIAGEESLVGHLLALDEKRPAKERRFTHLAERHRELREGEGFATATGRSSKGGRRPLTDEHYRTVALICLELYEAGQRRGISATVGARFTPPRDRRTVDDWIRKARHLQYLAPGKPGRVLFEPGPRLFEQSSEKGENDA